MIRANISVTIDTFVKVIQANDNPDLTLAEGSSF